MEEPTASSSSSGAGHDETELESPLKTEIEKLHCPSCDTANMDKVALRRTYRYRCTPWMKYDFDRPDHFMRASNELMKECDVFKAEWFSLDVKQLCRAIDQISVILNHVALPVEAVRRFFSNGYPALIEKAPRIDEWKPTSDFFVWVDRNFALIFYGMVRMDLFNIEVVDEAQKAVLGYDDHAKFYMRDIMSCERICDNIETLDIDRDSEFGKKWAEFYDDDLEDALQQIEVVLKYTTDMDREEIKKHFTDPIPHENDVEGGKFPETRMLFNFIVDNIDVLLQGLLLAKCIGIRYPKVRQQGPRMAPPANRKRCYQM
jgi:hypothetical protein